MKNQRQVLVCLLFDIEIRTLLRYHIGEDLEQDLTNKSEEPENGPVEGVGGEGTSTEAASNPGEDKTETSKEPDENPPSQIDNDESAAEQTQGNGDAENPSPEGASEPKEAQFPPIDPGAGSDTAAVEGDSAENTVSETSYQALEISKNC